MSGAQGVLVECPICRGEGVLSKPHPDPQLAEDGDCHGCSGGGSVDERHRAQLLDSMTDEALDALDRFERSRDEADRLLAAEHAHELAQRDREWWA